MQSAYFILLAAVHGLGIDAGPIAHAEQRNRLLLTVVYVGGAVAISGLGWSARSRRWPLLVLILLEAANTFSDIPAMVGSISTALFLPGLVVDAVLSLTVLALSAALLRMRTLKPSMHTVARR
jgi:hypothetical protein